VALGELLQAPLEQLASLAVKAGIPLALTMPTILVTVVLEEVVLLVT
jgi:hypothetical protein